VDSQCTISSVAVAHRLPELFKEPQHAALTIGKHTITAEDSGDDNYHASVSSGLTQKIYLYVLLPLIIR
jgi:hypothetical protein